MFSNWKPKIGAIGGFICFVITILEFCGVSAKDLGEFMTAHYLWLLGAIVSFLICVWGSYAWWKSTRTTPENVREKIRQWLDVFNTKHSVTPEFPEWLWGFEVILPNGPLLFIARTKARSDSILFGGKITALTTEHRAIYEALSQLEKNELYHKLRLETSRARFFFSSDQNLDQVTFDNWVPIRSLTHSSFIAHVNEMYFSANILWNTISLELGGKPQTALSPSTPGSAKGPLPDTEQTKALAHAEWEKDRAEKGIEIHLPRKGETGAP
jgi:hypothetical protein